MPLIKSAKKKLRQDLRRKKINAKYLKEVKNSLLAVKKSSGQKNVEKIIQMAYSKIDKAAKKGVIHKSKANRLKARVMRSIRKKK